VPRVLGGTHTVANLVPACQKCNYSRGATVGNRLRGGRQIAARPWRSSRRW
jgi:5-methylcytosine-specific restriction endonuclease McrA